MRELEHRIQLLAKDFEPGMLPSRGSESLISSIYEKYDSRLKKILWRRLSSREDVDDMSQEVYLKLAQYPDEKKLIPSMALIRTIACNLLNSRLRRRKVRKMDDHVAFNDFIMESPVDLPEEVLISREKISKVNKIFDDMDEKYQQAFVLNRLKGLTYDEIAIEMNISKHTVKKYISRALITLRERYGQGL